jgi:transcriptional regulator with XRE-family HTH domain
MQLAKEFDVSQSAVSKWLKGTVPSGETLVRLAIFFGVTPETLVGLESLFEKERKLAKASQKKTGSTQKESLEHSRDCSQDIEALLNGLRTKISASLKSLPSAEARNAVKVLQKVFGIKGP